jgi:hypothetical protein
MRGPVVLLAFLISFTAGIHAQEKSNHLNIQVAPWALGQVKVKAEYTRSSTLSFGSYFRYSWRSETLYLRSETMYFGRRSYRYDGEYKGIRFEPYFRIYLLPRIRNPLNGFYLQTSIMYGSYYRYLWDKYAGRYWDGPYPSAGAGLKTGFQKVHGRISMDVGLGCKFFAEISSPNMRDSWWEGPGFPISADLLVGIRF